MKLIFSICALLFITSTVHAEEGLNGDGIYTVSGRHDSRGPYAGHMRMAGSHFEKIIRYSDFKFKGFNVEEIWTGQTNGQTMSFSLKPSETLTQFEGATLDPSLFKSSTRISFSGNRSTYGSSVIGNYTEEYQRQGPASTQALWTSQRHMIDANGENESWALRLVRKLFIDRIIREWQTRPEHASWRHRAEYQAGNHFVIVDRTDFEFYRQNPNTLRVTNKIISPLSLAEAVQRRNAFSKSLTHKAQYFDSETVRLNLNPAGLLEMAHMNSQTQEKKGSIPEYDSALWTGMYLLSQVLRYEATGSAEAYENSRKVIDGLTTLVDIVESKKDFARTLAVSPASENLGEGWVQGKGAYSHLKWKTVGNNDMMKGVFFGFILAHRILKPTETELIAKIRRVVPKLLTLEVNKKRSFNLGIAYGAYALWMKDPAFITNCTLRLNSLMSELADGIDTDSGFHVGAISDWSGMHLITASTVSQILISQELIRAFPREYDIYQVKYSLKKGEERMYEIWKGFKKAQRHYMTAFFRMFSNPKYFDKLSTEDIENIRWTLREIPAPRFPGTGSADMLLRGDWVLSKYPALPWKGFKTPLGWERRQGIYAYPLYEGLAWGTSYLWKDNPFNSAYGSNAEIQQFPVDYLLAYWMGVRAGYISLQE